MKNSHIITHSTIFSQMLIFSLLSVILVSCNTQNKTENKKDSLTEKTSVTKEPKDTNSFTANTVTEIGRNIISIFQDKNNNYWFGTNSDGVYRYDGKTIIHFTQKDGLSGNQVHTIQEDKSGNIWFGTSGFGISRFDGKTFTTISNIESNNTNKEWNVQPDDLFFYAGGGAYRYNGNSFSYLPLPKTDFDNKYTQSPADQLGPYGVYCYFER